MTYARNGGSVSLPATAIVIPAYNEADIIADVILDLRATCDFPIFVIDDASTDNTAEVADKAGAKVIPLAVQLGAWGATQTGLRYALRKGFRVAITMDGDGQHDAAALRELIHPVECGQTDVSIGSCTERGSVLRKIAWMLMKQASGLSLDDITSGYRVYNYRAMTELASWRSTLLDYQDVGVLLLLQSSGIRIVDVPVSMNPRKNGKSHIFHSWLSVIYYMSQTLLLGLSKRQLASGYRKPRRVH